MTRPVDELSEPLTASEIALWREWAEEAAEGGYDHVSMIRPESALRLLDAARRDMLGARSATPSSEEDGLDDTILVRCVCHDFNHWTTVGAAQAGLARVAATPDNAGRSPIDAAIVRRAVHDVWPKGVPHTLGPVTCEDFAASLAARLSESTGSEEGA